jgi:endoglucanase
MSADNLEKNSINPDISVNLSYFNPAAYRIFAEFDPTHPWIKLVDSSYMLLAQADTAPLDKTKSTGLPPDWIEMDRTTGTLKAPSGTTNTTNFGYDALRVPWRLSLDAMWFKDPRAIATLQSFSALSTKWKASDTLASTYTHDGAVVTAAESPSMYGGTIGYFMTVDPTDAKAIYENKLQYLYNPGKNDWSANLSYYDDNWAWFGIALYNNLLPNLTAGLPATAFKQT